MFSGRDLYFEIGGTGNDAGAIVAGRVKGMRNKTLSFSASEVDVTSDDNEGWRELLVDSGVKSFDLSFEGVMDAADYDNWLQKTLDDAKTAHYQTVVTFPESNADPDVKDTQRNLTMNMFLSSMEKTGAFDSYVTVSGTLMSSEEPEEGYADPS